MLVLLHLLNTIKGDVTINDGTIGAVVSPKAHIGRASVVSQLHPSSKVEGVSIDTYIIHIHVY